jgi:hypothetical protein
VNRGSGYITTPTVSVADANSAPGTGASVTITGETSPAGGPGLAKYLTKKVVLDAGFDSGDLIVYTTAYRPVNTNILVYYKILNNDDTDNIDAKEWQLMTQTTTSVYSLSKQNLIEFECAPGVNGEADNYVSYTKGTETYNTFNQFQIKIVMSTTDTSNIPFLTDIRALAVPSGTGI